MDLVFSGFSSITSCYCLSVGFPPFDGGAGAFEGGAFLVSFFPPFPLSSS